jgi:predicted dehydrogenase
MIMVGKHVFLVVLMASLGCTSCSSQKGFTGAPAEVKLMTLDPGHFHAALIQKTSYDQVSPQVYVFAPEGPDVQDHLKRIEGFNTRAEDPTNWQESVTTGDDFLDQMIEKRPGNVVVISGNNRRKTEYIKACADAGLNQLVDKPMCIDQQGFDLLLEAFAAAEKNGVLLYDIMTERSEITTVLQRELMLLESVFGRLETGSADHPAVELESVHHFFKYVSGNPIKRPGWYMDTTQQGEGIVDVTTHLVDLVAWKCYPGVALDYHKDIDVVSGRRWPTMITKEQYAKVTQLDDFIPALKAQLNPQGVLPCYANGEITYKLKGTFVNVRVQWNYQAPEGAQDTHFALLRGTRANVVIRQGQEQNYRPELYVEPARADQIEALAQALPPAVQQLAKTYPGIQLKEVSGGWHIAIPDRYRIGHEAHFRQVTERYLQYLVDGRLPDWEVPNMIAKYYVTTKALEMAGE